MARFFESTVWSTIRLAGKKDPAALDDFVSRYRPAVSQFFRYLGHSVEESAELSQEVFLRIFQDDLLGKADPERGRFRSLLLAVARSVHKDALRRRHAEKRRGHIVPLDEVEPTGARDGSPEEFDRIFVQNILKIALDRLRREWENGYRALALHMNGLDYDEIAEQMGCSAKHVDNFLMRGKKRLIRWIREEVAAYARSGEEYQEEIRFLSRYLERPGR